MPAIPVRDGKTIHGYHWVSVAGNDWRRGVDQLAETIAKLKKANAQARLRGLAERVREARRELARAEARCELDHTISADIQHLKDLYARKALAQQNVDAKRSDYEAEYHRFLATFGEEFHPLGELVSVMEQEKAEAIERYRQEIEQAKKDARPIQWLMAIVVILFFLGGIAVLAIFG